MADTIASERKKVALDPETLEKLNGLLEVSLRLALADRDKLLELVAEMKVEISDLKDELRAERSGN